MPGRWLVNLDEARSALASQTTGERASFVMRHGSMRVGLYAPRDVDPQRPHSQDELYLVLTGGAAVEVDDETRHCGPGDVIFVPAGTDHRFTRFSPDFEVCVVFWGPEGGETG